MLIKNHLEMVLQIKKYNNMIYGTLPKSIQKESSSPPMLLLVVLILYSVLNIQTPPTLAHLIDNIYGNIAVYIIAAFYLLAHCQSNRRCCWTISPPTN